MRSLYRVEGVGGEEEEVGLFPESLKKKWGGGSSFEDGLRAFSLASWGWAMEAARGQRPGQVSLVSAHLFFVAARNASSSSQQQVRNRLHLYIRTCLLTSRT